MFTKMIINDFEVCINADGCTIVKYNGTSTEESINSYGIPIYKVVIPATFNIEGKELPVTEILH